MKVIFIKDLKGQGKKNEIKEVKDGYAMNFLIKNGYAVAANTNSINKLQKETEEKKLEESLLIKEMNVLKAKLEKDKFIFKASTGNQDRMFGQISGKQIKLELEEKGYKIDKNKIILENPITTLGVHEVMIELHKEVIATIKVQVIKE